MRLLLLLPLLTLAGCHAPTRAEYEQANGLPIVAEHEHDNGDVQVVYGPDRNPSIDPVTGDYRCAQGMRVAVYRDGVLTRKWFQPHERMPGQVTP